MPGTGLSDTIITLQESADTWPQALEICAKPLLDAGVITAEYITAIVQQHHAPGPYYVLAPGMAMPHARIRSCGINCIDGPGCAEKNFSQSSKRNH